MAQQPLSRCPLNTRGANGGSASHPPSNWAALAVQGEFLSLSRSIPVDLDGGMNSSSESSSVQSLTVTHSLCFVLLREVPKLKPRGADLNLTL